MLENDFLPNAPGRLVPTEAGDGIAFVPDALPPKLFRDLDLDLATKLSEADVALAQLNGLARTLEDPQILLQPFILKEALESSRIEGTQTTYPELLLFEVKSTSGKRRADPDTKVVANYLTALTHGLEQAKKLPFSRRLICELHGSLMHGYNESKSRPGVIRSGQVVIGARNATPRTARFVPAPRTYLDVLISDLEGFYNNDSSVRMPLLLRAAFVHYQFEAIHPFWDGNGRVGRLLISLMLTREGRLFRPMLYLSGFFERHRPQYYDRLFAVSARAEWGAWVAFFLEGVKVQADDAFRRIQRLQKLRHELEERLKQRKGRANSDFALLRWLFRGQITSVPLARKWLNLSAPSAKECIERLVTAGILFKLDNVGGQTRFWMAPEIIQAIQSEE